MKAHLMGVQAFLLPFLTDGSKDLEIRVADKRRARIVVGDTIIFNGILERVVIAIRRYTSFGEMLENEKLSRIHPTASSKEVITALRQFYPQKAESSGVLVFELATTN